ncbi:MAG: recombinase family protein, partial [Betaproteobacteria bacterium]
SFFDDLNNRPVLLSLLALIESAAVKHLFVYNADRLSRNQQTWAIIRYKLLTFGVTLHAVSGQMKLKNPVDDLMLGILSEISQYDNRIRSERSRMGKFQKIQQGNWKGGPPSFGYRLENKQLMIDDFESEWIQKMFDWYCHGVPVKEIQYRLSRHGVMTRRGNQQWSLGSIQLILRNPVYAGVPVAMVICQAHQPAGDFFIFGVTLGAIAVARLADIDKCHTPAEC